MSSSSSNNPRPSSFNPRASMSTSNYKPRQYAHLQAQLAQLQANLADTEELLQMTRTQAENIRILGGLHGGFFMAASKVFEDSDQNGAGGRQ